MYDLIIIGAGPAGLTAALYALRAGKKVLVLEEKAYGGQIINAQKVKNYPGIIEVSGRDWAMTLFQQVKNFGGETKLEKAVSLKVDGSEKIIMTDMDEEYRTKTVVISTGTRYRKLGLSKEDELVGKGISYCATCDGNFYQDKDVAVVGGGNTALMDAIYLSGIAKKVYLIHRRDEFRG
ncbi:FAD-dependent oxidoreductase, partial [Candidatus Saccharibacteria bacterium]|nr:FAD-dependent oxidoreductase [Candidatus Saccharibacteria bacterium]